MSIEFINNLRRVKCDRGGPAVRAPERVALAWAQATEKEARMATCTHLDQIELTELPESVEGCAECLASGDPWLHLRICLECGHVGCCDDSPNKHASRHARSSSHPLIRSLEPGETWSWCYVDEVAMLLEQVQGSTRIPPSPMLSGGPGF
jgi:uncharacterized UBP type Zn finger protein